MSNVDYADLYFDDMKKMSRESEEDNYSVIYYKGNEFFDTYHVKNKNGEYIGIIEKHCRQVKRVYFVGWHFDGNFIPGAFQSGKTETFYSEMDALNYVTDEYTK